LTEYEYLLKELHLDWKVYGLQTPWHEAKSAPTSYEELASYFIKKVKTVQPNGPYYFLGYCSAGVIAYEMARQLSDIGEEVCFLGLTDVMPPKYRYRLDMKSMYLLADKIALVLSNIVNVPSDLRRRRAQSIPTAIYQFILNLIPVSYAGEHKHKEPTESLYPNWITDMPESCQPVTIANYSIYKKYAIKPYKGSITLFFSSKTRESLINAIYYCPCMGWEKFVEDDIKIYFIPGDHTTMIQPPNVKELARAVEECLAGRRN
jgi:thioesterase domain-containing protein